MVLTAWFRYSIKNGFFWCKFSSFIEDSSVNVLRVLLFNILQIVVSQLSLLKYSKAATQQTLARQLLWGQPFSEDWRFQNLVFQPMSLPLFSYLSRQSKKPPITRRHRSLRSRMGKFIILSIAVESSLFIISTLIYTDVSFSLLSSIV